MKSNRRAEDSTMQQWQRVWRLGLAPELSKTGVEQLRAALVRDDLQIVQRETVFPPPLEVFATEPIECACAVGYCLWKGRGLRSVGELAAAFARLCMRVDARLGEPAATRHFLDWFDSAPRWRMRQDLLAEVDRLLNKRSAA
jgi:hypothetical protein